MLYLQAAREQARPRCTQDYSGVSPLLATQQESLKVTIRYPDGLVESFIADELIDVQDFVEHGLDMKESNHTLIVNSKAILSMLVER